MIAAGDFIQSYIFYDFFNIYKSNFTLATHHILSSTDLLFDNKKVLHNRDKFSFGIIVGITFRTDKKIRIDKKIVQNSFEEK